MMLTDYKVRAIIYPHGEYRLGNLVPVLDEGAFYRIDGTHIIDKFKIEHIDEQENRVLIVMKDKEIKLVVER